MPPARSSLDVGVLWIRSVNEPDGTLAIDDLRRGSLFHLILQRFHAEWQNVGSASLAVEPPERMRRLDEQECEAAEARWETGYPAM